MLFIPTNVAPTSISAIWTSTPAAKASSKSWACHLGAMRPWAAKGLRTKRDVLNRPASASLPKWWCEASGGTTERRTIPSFKTEDPTARISNLQNALDEAVADEQYASAARIRDELRSAATEDYVLILNALLNYYDAFSLQNVDRVRRQWHDGASVVCQHPMSTCHVGYSNVVSSYTALFKTLPNDLTVSLSDVRIAVHGLAAYVTCVELPHSASLSEQLNRGRGDDKVKWHGLMSTNIFEKVWDYRSSKFQYLLVHHASGPILKP